MIDYGYGIQLDTLDKAVKAREWRNDKEIYDNCRQVGLISEKDQQNWLANGDIKHMFAVIIDSGCIGVAGITNIHNTHRCGEISLYIAKEHHSLGIGAKPIIKTLAAYAFEMLNLNRIFGETYSTNVVELLNLKELGFITEGTLRQTYYKNGQYIDSVIQSLLRSEYDRLKDGWRC